MYHLERMRAHVRKHTFQLNSKLNVNNKQLTVDLFEQAKMSAKIQIVMCQN